MPKKLSFKSDEEAEKYFDEHLEELKIKNPKKNYFAEQIKKHGSMIIVRDENGEIFEKYDFRRIKIDNDLLEFFGTNEERINHVLRQLMELDKTLHQKMEPISKT